MYNGSCYSVSLPWGDDLLSDLGHCVPLSWGLYGFSIIAELVTGTQWLKATHIQHLSVLEIRSLHQGFLGVSVVKNTPANAGDTSSIPGQGRPHMSQSI